MKALRYILLSYLQQHFFGVLLIVVGFIHFIPATVLALFGKRSITIGTGFEPWALHFLGFLFIVYTVAMHLRTLIKTNAGALLPHYRRNQLIAAGVLIAFFISVPILINGFRGLAVLAPLTMFLFTAGLVLWGVFVFGDNLAVLAVIIWLGKLVHEMLGYKLKIMIFRTLPDSSLPGSELWVSILIMMLSCGILFLFGLYLIKIPYKDLWDSPRDRSDPYTKDYDKVGDLTYKIVMRKIAGMMSRMTEGKKKSPVYLARVLQPALFSPGHSSIINSLIYLAGFMLYMITVGFVFFGSTDFTEVETRFSVGSFLVLLYLVGIGILTNDLLQHRHRLAEFWFRVQLTSRKAFARAAVLTYVLVTVRQFLMTTVAVVILQILLREPFFKSLLVVVTGFVACTLFLTLSLLLSDLIVSPDSKGWLIFSIFAGMTASMIYAFIVKGTVYRSPGIWWFLLVVEIFVLFLFWLAVRKWSDTEMNFTGPDIMSQY